MRKGSLSLVCGLLLGFGMIMVAGCFTTPTGPTLLNTSGTSGTGHNASVDDNNNRAITGSISGTVSNSNGGVITIWAIDITDHYKL